MQITLRSGVAEGIGLHFLFENGPLVDVERGSGDLVQLFRVSAGAILFRDLVQLFRASRIGVNGNIRAFYTYT